MMHLNLMIHLEGRIPAFYCFEYLIKEKGYKLKPKVFNYSGYTLLTHQVCILYLQRLHVDSRCLFQQLKLLSTLVQMQFNV